MLKLQTLPNATRRRTHDTITSLLPLLTNYDRRRSPHLPVLPSALPPCPYHLLPLHPSPSPLILLLRLLIGLLVSSLGVLRLLLCVDGGLLLIDDGLRLLLHDDDWTAHGHDGRRAAHLHLSRLLRYGATGTTPGDATVITTILLQSVSCTQRRPLPSVNETTARELHADVINAAVGKTR